mmetsp:Transcript_13060/g.30121  ORF Transcript_13060/g.30121 Transcript_13060/m.30121 type:complete len:84 (+) Transcript_13060:2-253(+)
MSSHTFSRLFGINSLSLYHIRGMETGAGGGTQAGTTNISSSTSPPTPAAERESPLCSLKNGRARAWATRGSLQGASESLQGMS